MAVYACRWPERACPCGFRRCAFVMSLFVAIARACHNAGIDDASSLSWKGRTFLKPTELRRTLRTAFVSLIAAAALPASAAAPADLKGWCESLAQRLPSISTARCTAAALRQGDGRSVQGVPLWHHDITPRVQPALLKVLVLGGIHGDEAASVSLVFDWIARASDTDVDRVQWRMVPLVNPDGFLRRPATRVNSRGVDLNRNFPTTDWASNAQRYWVERTGRDPRRFPGQRAMSEPETQWVHKQIEQFKPDLIVSVHAPYGVLDFDGPPPAPEKLGSLFLDQVGIYPGSLGNYGGVGKGVPVVTIELKHALKLPGSEMASMWADLQDWIDRRLLRLARAAEAEPAARHHARHD